ncbi:glycosyltransferase [Lacrimispora sp.]|uniref:glycosyltransferase n=1 Tax=Lacrimispora sp. TaxID=2719234 RepID=UPI00285F8E40|nr:glycosyltransferase [Lacrimispora sp.]MDR7813047.1 glycosyltransferase [Lacrimispora sp.]
MVRVLQKTATLGPGGIQKFLINVQSNIDNNSVQFDYFLNTLEQGFFTETALSLGSKIYGNEHNDGNPLAKLWKRYTLFYKTIKKEGYSIIHIDETLEMTAISVLVSRIAGANVIIAHSHNDHASDKIKWYNKFIINPIARVINSTLATDHFACSEIAAKWLFTPRLLSENKVQIVNNGIESKIYEYNSKIEKKYREKLGLVNSFVVGHVGRFYYQKNHKFIIEVFARILECEPSAKLILIGEGELKEEMIRYAKKLNIINNVIFYGVSDEVNKLIQVFDAFIFPSIFEGLGIVAVEAQAASVQTFCAEESIAKEVDITPYCHYIPLSKGAEYWGDIILNLAKSYKKISTRHFIEQANFDIRSVAKKLKEFYMSKG